jgi:hypothetical protein
MKHWLQGMPMRVLAAALQAAVFVALIWLALHFGCSKQIIACVDVTTEFVIWGFLVATVGFYFYRPGRTRLSQLKGEYHRKVGGGNRYFDDHNRPDGLG